MPELWEEGSTFNMFSECTLFDQSVPKCFFFANNIYGLYLGPSSVIKKVHELSLCFICYFTLFPTAIVLPSGLQQIFMFSPLVFTTETHLLAAKIKQTVLHKFSSSNFYKINLFLDLKMHELKGNKG